jgi:hypothetical protein
MTARLPAISERSAQVTLWSALILIAALSGCSRDEPRGRISGRVTCRGKAVSEGRVLFVNTDKGVNMTASLAPDGSFEVLTAKGPGLPLAEYRVAVCPPPPDAAVGTFGSPPTIKPYANIPEKYREPKTSGLILTVVEGENRFDVAM